jgi:iron complex transport system permease protein
MSQNKLLVAYTGIAVMGVLLFGLSMFTGAISVSWIDFVSILSGNRLTSPEAIALLQLRLPRILAGFLVGGALACSGLALQGLFRNPMAAPGVIGVSSGGALGAIVLIQLGFGSLIFTTTGAFFSAMLTVFLVYRLASRNGRVPVTTLLLAGLAVGAFYTALIGLVLSVSSPYRLNRLLFWLLGGLDGTRWDSVIGLSVPVTLGLIGLWFVMEPLDLLNSGDATARSLGVNVRRTKQFTLLWVALITASAVSVSGVIGFVGLIVPHVNRMMFGPNHRLLFPLVFLTGGVFLIGADLLARTIIRPAELRIGIITALAGVPFFLYLLRTQKVEWGV